MCWVATFQNKHFFLTHLRHNYLNYIELQAHFSGSHLNAPPISLMLFDISGCHK